MIRITVELIPFGVGTPRKIAQATITNTGSGTPASGNYSYSLDLERKKSWRAGYIACFPRARRNVWYLIRRCLEQIGRE